MLPFPRFAGLWQRLTKGELPAELPVALERAYAEPHRAYHNASHIFECLAWFDEVSGQMKRPDEVETAIWFHDAVYDPRAGDNEERSAAWACAALAAAPEEARERIRSLILSTKDHVARTMDGAVLLDIDLSILGAAPERFHAYDDAIRCEYAWVSEADYRAGRRRVLTGFLARPQIYGTSYFHERLEKQARDNLVAALARLSEPDKN